MLGTVRYRFLILITVVLVVCGCSSGPKIPLENEKRIKEYWRLYLAESPEWEASREAWLALGEGERTCLINYLILDISKNVNRPRRGPSGELEPGWMRPAAELERLGRASLLPSLNVLKKTRDETIVLPFVEVLGRVARVEDLESAFRKQGGGDHVSFQSRLVKVLFRLEDPKAVEWIVTILQDPYDWQVRATAAETLGHYRGPHGEKVRAALSAVQNDEDAYVGSQAKKSLSLLKRAEDSGSRQ